MSNKHDVRDYLHDIVDAIDDIMQFTQGITFEQFQSDKRQCMLLCGALK